MLKISANNPSEILRYSACYVPPISMARGLRRHMNESYRENLNADNSGSECASHVQ